MQKRMGSAGWWHWLLVSAIVVAVDQLTKWWVVVKFDQFESSKLLPFLNLTLVYNKGAAFSFLSTQNGWQVVFLLVTSLTISALLVYWLAKTSAAHRWQSVALALIIGGAIGNVIDRLRQGKVVDFIDFHVKQWHFPTFNVADMAVSIGVFILILCLFLYEEKKP